MTLLTPAKLLGKLSPERRAVALAVFTKNVLDTFRALPKGVSPVYARLIAAIANGGTGIVIEGVDEVTLKQLGLAGFTIERTGGVNNEARIRWVGEMEVMKVVFRVSRKDGKDVYALLPESQADYNNHVTCYQHVGGHCAADYHMCMRESRPATPKEYAGLKSEMEQRGYILQVVKRARPFFRK